MRIVVDTNVIVSALVCGGVPRQMLDLAVTGVCSFYLSAPIQAEVERILEEKFGWSSEGSIYAPGLSGTWKLKSNRRPRLPWSPMILMTTAF